MVGDRSRFRGNSGPRLGFTIESRAVLVASWQAERWTVSSFQLTDADQRLLAHESPADEPTIVPSVAAESHFLALAPVARTDSTASAEATASEGSDAGKRKPDASERRSVIRQHGF